MKLFFSPGATSLAVRIVCHEIGLRPEFVQVDLERQCLAATGQPYAGVHPLGKVPALSLDDGSVLTESVAILQYVADLEPARGLAPPFASLERYRLVEALAFLATEVHKGHAALFDAELPAAWRQRLLRDTRAVRRIAAMVAGDGFLFGAAFTVADAYLYSLLRLALHAGMDFSSFPAIPAYFQRVQQRPSVRASARAEGLIGD